MLQNLFYVLVESIYRAALYDVEMRWLSRVHVGDQFDNPVPIGSETSNV